MATYGLRGLVLTRLAMARGAIVTDAALLAWCYPGPDGGPVSAENCIQVAVCALRKRLPRGAITRERGIGYRLDPAVAAALPPVDDRREPSRAA